MPRLSLEARMRRSALAMLLFLGLAVPAARAGIEAGEERQVQSRSGSALREEPRPLAKRAALLAYGTPVKVLEVRDLWARVDAAEGRAGWIRASELVAPGALTGSHVAVAGSQFSHSELSAAGRQFDQKTEATFRTMDARVAPAYAKVDEIERSAPTDEEVEAWVRDGFLGGFLTDPSGASGAKYARLKLLETNGDPEPATQYEDLMIAQAKPLTDAEFVQRLSLGFSPEQEYWLGRSVAAFAIARHGLDPDPARQALVRRVGAALVRLSDRVRQTYGGYRFAVLDTDQPNGIAGPGGFVLITRGALSLARTEDEVAGILAHEIAHISRKHGEATIRQSRDFQKSMERLKAAVAAPVPGQDCNICGDVARTLGTSAKVLVDNLDDQGYAKDYEFQADYEGSLFLCDVGYRVSSIAEYLEVLPKREGARWTTHPSCEDRIEALRPLLFKHGCPFDSDAGAQLRLPRFHQMGFGLPAR
jgi:SH3-like domain-containing protein